MDNKLLTISQAGKILGVSPKTLKRWEKSGKIKIPRTPTGNRFFTKESLEALKNNLGISQESAKIEVTKVPTSHFPTFKPSLRFSALTAILVVSVLVNFFLFSKTDYPNKAVLGVKDFIAPALEESAPLGNLLSKVGDVFRRGSFVVPFLGRTELETSGDLSVKGKATIAKDIESLGNLRIKGDATVGRLVTGIIDPYLIENDGDVQSFLEIRTQPSSLGSADIVFEPGGLEKLRIKENGNVVFNGSVLGIGSLTASGNLTATGDIQGANITGSKLKTTGDLVVDKNITLTGVINSTRITDNKLVFGGDSPSIYPGTTNTAISLNANGTGAISIGNSSTGNIYLGGGSTSTTRCFVSNSSGNFTCTGNISGGATGTVGYWTRSGTTLSPQTSGDAITTSGNLSTTGSGTLSIAGTSTLTGAATLSSTLAVTGATTLSSTLAVNGATLSTTQTTFNLINTTATTLNIGGAATTLSIGASTGTTTINNAATITGAATLSSTLAVTGITTLSGNLLPNATGTLDLGTSTVGWRTLHSDGATGVYNIELHFLNGAANRGSAMLFRQGSADTARGFVGVQGFWEGNNNSGFVVGSYGTLILRGGGGATTLGWDISSDGHLLSAGATDNLYDIGASGATRPRTGYFGTALAIGTNPSTTGVIRAPNNPTGGIISARNAANTGDIAILSLNASNEVLLPTGANTLVIGGPQVWGSDNTYDIGASGATRPRSIYVGTSVLAPDGSAAAPSLAFSGDTASGVFRLPGSGVLFGIAAGGVGRWFLPSTGDFRAYTDNAYDIGASAANRPRSIYLGTLTAASATTVCRDANGGLSTCSSSRKFKDNITYLSDNQLSDILGQITDSKLATFTYKTDRPDLTRYGLIAEEAPLPLRIIDPNGNNNLDFYSAQLGYTWAGIKALNNKLTIDEGRLVDLESSNKKLLTTVGLPTPTPSVSPSPTPSPTPTPTPIPNSILSRLDLLEKSVFASSSASFDTLTVLKKLLTSDLGITGKISSGLLAIEGLNPLVASGSATINTLSNDLYLQNLGVGGVNFVSGKVLIDKNGNLTSQKTITAQGFAVAGDSTGKATLPANQAQVEITSAFVNENSKIFVTSRTKTGGQALHASARTLGKFTVSIEQPYTSDITFDYWIIN